VQNTGDNHVPTWLARPSGVSFGFGGKLVDFSAQKPATPDPSKTPKSTQVGWLARTTVNFRQLIPDQELVKKTAQFSQATPNVDCKAYCDQKVMFVVEWAQTSCIV
jgi:hypothetical protein